MTPTEEAALAQRRWIILRLMSTGVFLVLLAFAFVLLGPLQVPTAGFAVLGIAIAAYVVFPFAANRLANRGLPTTEVTAPVSDSANARAAEWNAED